MKSTLILSTMMFFACFGYSQSRVNPKKDLIIGDYKHWINDDDISGWDLDKGEEWKERKGYLRVGNNVGYIDINEKYNLKGSVIESKGRTSQNFNEIGVISVSFKDEKYTGFAIEKVIGLYRYPSIKEDYYTYNNYNVYLFKNEELQKLANLEGEATLNVFIGTYGDPLFSDKRYQSCYENLKFLLERGMDIDEDVMKFKKTKNEGYDVVRFLLPQTISRYTETIDFNDHYFEVTANKFSELKTLLFDQ